MLDKKNISIFGGILLIILLFFIVTNLQDSSENLHNKLEKVPFRAESLQFSLTNNHNNPSSSNPLQNSQNMQNMPQNMQNMQQKPPSFFTNDDLDRIHFPNSAFPPNPNNKRAVPPFTINPVLTKQLKVEYDQYLVSNPNFDPRPPKSLFYLVFLVI